MSTQTGRDDLLSELAPMVSVIVTVSGASRVDRLRASIASVLSQTLHAIDVVILDSGVASDALAGLAEPRLRIVQTGGLSWSDCLAVVRGRYIAFLQPGDISLPTRLARQSAYLDAHPGISVLATAARLLKGGIPARNDEPAALAASSLMITAEAARSRGGDLPAAHWVEDFCQGLAALGQIPSLDHLLTLCTEDTPATAAALPPAKPGRLFSTPYYPCPMDLDTPPTLFVVVDTEAEFDWAKPFARELNSVSAMDNIERGQEVFDPYGLRPIYAVDYPVASQPNGFSRLRAIMDRDGCEIGAHLHPWTNPPFEEALSPRNSYPGNLDPALEDRKLTILMAAIRENFGISPVFYKAGRYGFGPATAQMLARHGIRVDLSVLPGADLRRNGGPDFRALDPVCYRIGETGVMSLPMTRSEVGLMPSLARIGNAVQNAPGGSLLHLPSILARLRLADTITLTPEGVTSDEQIRLIRAMLTRGCRRFVLHYHSPSLSPGNTPYARDRTGAETVIARLQDVCSFFFDELGGVPGYPRDLLRVGTDTH